MKKILLVLAVLALSGCAMAYDAQAPQEFCCRKVVPNKAKEREEERRAKQNLETVQIDPTELQALLQCRILMPKNPAGFSSCVRRYINPWESHHVLVERWEI